MMIKNFNSLANTDIKKNALLILESGLSSAQPKNFLKEFVNKNHILLGKNQILLSNYKRIFVVAYGKAADSMTEYVSKKINISRGIVVVPKYTKPSLSSEKFQIFYSMDCHIETHKITKQLKLNVINSIGKVHNILRGPLPPRLEGSDKIRCQNCYKKDFCFSLDKTKSKEAKV